MDGQYTEGRLLALEDQVLAACFQDLHLTSENLQWRTDTYDCTHIFPLQNQKGALYMEVGAF